VNATDDDIEVVLAALGVKLGRDALLGHGGEATIYALDQDRVLRLLHKGAGTDKIHRNKALLQELNADAVPFRIPEVLEVGEVYGRAYSIESRLAGRSMSEALKTIEGPDRDRLIEAYLEAANVLGDLRAEPWTFYGELAAGQPVRAETWCEFLTRRAAKSLEVAGDPLDQIPAETLTVGLPEPAHSEFVHLDAFPGNMLCEGTRITAVLDFGPTCIAGDRRFDPLSAAVYLDPAHTHLPNATIRDEDVARTWLRSAGLIEMLEPVRRWLAGYWAFAVDEASLQAWCRSVLSRS
jgi:hypothetical protein